mmetsp:Transcript_29148/g.73194  ORF Transcript_29148/g.73194 Transcript_29148/m.73194 type:complete len:196 (-) Transcript_29148:434-1021(-)
MYMSRSEVLSPAQGSATAESSEALNTPTTSSLMGHDARLSSPLILECLDANSIVELAQLFYRGECGCPKDEARAFSLWRHAAVERQYPHAQYWLGTAYCLGVGVAADFTCGRKWLERAASAGDYLALYNLGCMYFRGDGVPVDTLEAKTLWEQARQLGSAEATLALAQLARRSRTSLRPGQSQQSWRTSPLEITC